MMTSKSRTCYAARLGHCSRALTREHYISAAVLNQVGSAVWIEGAARTPPASYPVSALAARVLCANHNSQLSELDTAAAYAFRKMRQFQSDLDAGATRTQSESATVDGSALERWMLKLALGMLTARQLRNPQLDEPIVSVRRGYELTLLRVLFLGEPWPSRWGMYFEATHGQSFAAPTTADGSTAEFGVEARSNPADGTLWALGMWFRSFGWVLALGKPDYLSAEMHRPAGLRLTRVGEPASRTLYFSWADGTQHHALLDLTRQGELG